MRPFQVTGSAVQVGPGEQMVLNPGQIAARKHQVREIEKLADDGILVEALALLTFKVGEVIGLKEVPKQAREQMIDLRAAEEAARVAAENPEPEPASKQAHGRRR